MKKESRMKKIPGWALALLAMVGLPAQADQDVLHTKFGNLMVSADKVLHFHGKPVVPGVVGKQSLSMGPVLDRGDTVLVLTTQQGDGGCLGRFNIIILSAQKAQSTPTFGTCDALSAVQPVERGWKVETQGSQGVHTYVFADAVLTDNGRVVSDRFRTQQFAVPAITDDPDGYANVRQGPSSQSPIVARVGKGQVFRTHPQPGEWWQVQIRPDLMGYVHKSRVLMTRDF